MKAGNKYLIFGFAPIRFNSEGQWYVDVDSALCRAPITWAVRFLLSLNTLVEAASGHTVKLTPPMKRVEEKHLQRTANHNPSTT